MSTIPFPLRLLLAAALGLLTPLAFAPYDWHWLPPLLLAVLFALAVGTGWRRAMLIGWTYGAAEFGYGLHWIGTALQGYGQLSGSLALALTILLCAYLALYPALVLGIAERMGLFGRRLGWIGVPALWLFGELLRRELLWGGFPWFALGYSQLDTLLARLAPAVGVYGISAVLVWIAYALYSIASSRRHRGIELAALFAPALALFLPRPGLWTETVGRPVSIAIVQAGVPEDKLLQPGMADRLTARYRELTLANIGNSLVVWPEDALPQSLQRLEKTLLENFRQVLRAHGTTLLFGVLDAQSTSLDTPLLHNSAVAVGMTEGRYDKRHRMPFAEFLPLPKSLRPPGNLPGTSYTDIAAGAGGQPLLVIGDNPVALTIAYEDAYGAEFRDDARRAGYLINLGNDARYERSNAAALHLQIARMRAIEYGREMVRATGTGISAFVGADGSLQEQSAPFAETVLHHNVQPHRGTTPYMRWGDAPLWWISGLISLGLTGFALRRRAPSMKKA